LALYSVYDVLAVIRHQLNESVTLKCLTGHLSVTLLGRISFSVFPNLGSFFGKISEPWKLFSGFFRTLEKLNDLYSRQVFGFKPLELPRGLLYRFPLNEGG